MKIGLWFLVILAGTLTSCASRGGMAVSYYQSPGDYHHLSSCFYRTVEDSAVYGNGGPILTKADLQDPAEIQIAMVDGGIERWEVDFAPNVTGTALTLREFSILGGQNPSWVNRVEQRIDHCGGTLTPSAAG
jgi:hypothetical protein